MRRWEIPELNKDAAAALAEACAIPPLLALMLVSRGVTSADEAAEFITGGDLTDDPFAFADMDMAVDRIQRAMDGGELIGIYGDYDADGITSTVLLYTYLREKGVDAVYYLPEREKDGYGLQPAGVDILYAQGVKLIVTVDNGITAAEAVDYAAQKGIDVVVTDHHQPPEQLPAAVAVVDPHRADCGSRFKDYAGVGVAFQLVCALDGDPEAMLDRFGDLVAIGTLADVMPLIGENRTLVRAGLQCMSDHTRLGLTHLLDAAGRGGRALTANTVAFTVAPRLNAAGRMDTPEPAARLLMTTQDTVAQALAASIQQCNVKRQEVEARILREAIGRLQREPELLHDRVLVIDGENWHPGVLGILAARLVEYYSRPCLLLSRMDGEVRGSGRSVEGFPLLDAIAACGEHLVRFGGHALAAGIGIEPGRIADFRRAINDYAAHHFPIMPLPVLRLDCKLRPAQVDVDKLSLIAALEPLGAGNPAPVFGLYNMTLTNLFPVGQGRHVRLSLTRDGVQLSALQFGAPYATYPYHCGQRLHVAVTLERDDNRGVPALSILVKDVRAADTPEEELTELYEATGHVLRGEPVTREQAAAWRPTRDDVARVYRRLRTGWIGPVEQLRYDLEQPAIPCIRIRLALEALRQAGLISLTDRGWELEIAVLPVREKVDLNATPVLAWLDAQAQGE